MKEKNSNNDQEFIWKDLINNVRRLQRSNRQPAGPQILKIKKKEFLENDKIIQRGLVRWECMCRNKTFRQLYKANPEILRLDKDVCLTPETTKESISKAIARIRIKVKKDGSRTFESRSDEKKYTTYFYFLKDLGRPDSLDNSAVKAKNLSGLIHHILTPKDVSRLNKKEINRFIEQIPQQVEFVVDFGYSQKEILSEFKKQIDMWFRLYEAARMNNSRRALHYSNIHRYLKVYDLKNSRLKPTFVDLATQLYPGAASKNLDSTVQQVKREYKRADELINGGFVFIK